MGRNMKDSGIEWIGLIPEEWKIVKFKTQADIIMGQSPDGNDIKSEGQTLFMQGNREFGEKYPNPTLYCDTCNKHSRVGDILMSVRAPVGAINEADKVYGIGRGLCSIKAENIDNGFLKYYLKKSVDDLRYYSNGSTFEAITVEILENFRIAIPTEIEQVKIAGFLDDKIGEVDIIIKKTKASVEEYKKYKQAVITEVALGGLDKTIATRDSGIDWIGNIPEHWEIKPFKFVMTERNEKNIPVKTDERLALSIDKGITTYAEKTTNLDRFKDDVTQYKLAYEGDLVFNSMNMIVGAIGYSNYFGCVSPVYYTYYDNVEGHYTSKYYEYIFRSKTMRKVLFSLGKGIMAIDRGDDKINTCRLKVSRDDLRCLKVPVPTEQEQQEIVKYLDAKCAEIDALIVKKEAFVEEMETYKQSLIYEYVTGKKEVL